MANAIMAANNDGKGTRPSCCCMCLCACAWACRLAAAVASVRPVPKEAWLNTRSSAGKTGWGVFSPFKLISAVPLPLTLPYLSCI